MISYSLPLRCCLRRGIDVFCMASFRRFRFECPLPVPTFICWQRSIVRLETVGPVFGRNLCAVMTILSASIAVIACWDYPHISLTSHCVSSVKVLSLISPGLATTLLQCSTSSFLKISMQKYRNNMAPVIGSFVNSCMSDWGMYSNDPFSSSTKAGSFTNFPYPTLPQIILRSKCVHYSPPSVLNSAFGMFSILHSITLYGLSNASFFVWP